MLLLLLAVLDVVFSSGSFMVIDGRFVSSLSLAKLLLLLLLLNDEDVLLVGSIE